MSLLVVGTVAFDAIETPYGKRDKIIGGAATYIGLSASKFYNKINLLSVVGEDFPKEAISMLNKNNINTEGLQVKKNEKTFFWSGRYHNDMNLRDTLETQLNVLKDFSPLVPTPYLNCECLMLGNLMPSIQQKVLNQLQGRPKLIVLDTMNFWMDNFMSDLKIALKNIDILTINDEEARQLSGKQSLIKAAKTILSYGPKTLIIKKGEHGALLFNKKEVFFAPAYPLEEVYDPTGAGDTFAGGLIGHLCSTRDYSFNNIKTAVIIGSAMASFCVEKFGTEKINDLEMKEIHERINKFKHLVQYKNIEI